MRMASSCAGLKLETARLRAPPAACKSRLQPYVSRAATVCIPGCNPMYPGLQPYVSRRLEVLEGSPLCADAGLVLACELGIGLGSGSGLGLG